MIKRYDCTNGGYQYCAGCYQMSIDEYGDYLRVEDMKTRLEAILWALQPCDQYDTVKLQLEQLIEELK